MTNPPGSFPEMASDCLFISLLFSFCLNFLKLCIQANKQSTDGVVENESVGVEVEVVSQVAVLVFAEELSEHLVRLVAALFALHDFG
jgi:hypothetical protein